MEDFTGLDEGGAEGDDFVVLVEGDVSHRVGDRDAVLKSDASVNLLHGRRSYNDSRSAGGRMHAG